MSSIIPSTTAGKCGICLVPFDQGELRYTHLGGEKHEGFHKDCFVPWLKQKSVCPIDMASINSATLIPLKDRIKHKALELCKAVALSAGFALAVFAIGMTMVAVTTTLTTTIVSGKACDPLALYDFRGDNSFLTG